MSVVMVKMRCGVRWLAVAAGVVAALMAAMAAQAEAVSIEVEDAYVRGLPPTQRNTAAFFILKNTGDRDLEVLAAPAPDLAERVEIHAHRHRNGMMSMQQQASVTIPAGQSVAFAPGELHLMLIELNRPLRDGDTVSLALQTSGGETLTFSAPVISVLKEGKSGSGTGRVNSNSNQSNSNKDNMGHAHH